MLAEPGCGAGGRGLARLNGGRVSQPFQAIELSELRDAIVAAAFERLVEELNALTEQPVVVASAVTSEVAATGGTAECRA